jgi:NodT family efflux transporter outer membrane factor (OMF) lipoprotein
VEVAREWPRDDWWREFRSPELEELLQAARSANDDLRSAVARVREADAQQRIAGAPLLPTVTVGGTAVRERTSVSGEGFQTYDQFVPLLTVGYEFDFWGRNRAALAAARATAAASRYDRQTVELTMLASVASTYFQVLELRDRVAAAQTSAATATRVLRGLEREQEVGTASALDVAQQASAAAALEAAVPPLRQQEKQAFDALAVLLGVTPDALEVKTRGLAEVAVPAVGAGLPSELLARRPDVAESEAQLVAANANVAAARSAFFPSISLTGTGGYQSSALSTLLTPATRIWSLGAGLTQPIFAGGALYGQSQYAKARYSELLAQYHKSVVSAFANVDDALTAAAQTAAQLERQQHAVDEAARTVAIANAQLRAGTINVLTLLGTDAALYTAEDALAQVKFARLQASLDLYKALGGGWTRDFPAATAKP